MGAALCSRESKCEEVVTFPKALTLTLTLTSIPLMDMSRHLMYLTALSALLSVVVTAGAAVLVCLGWEVSPFGFHPTCCVSITD